jgi:serine/threonine protein kinase
MSNPFASVATKSSLRDIVQYDQYSDFSKNKEIQKVEWSDIAVSKVLGQGGFSNVFRVTVCGEEECERSLCSSSSNCDEGPKEYALKCLDPKAMTSADDFMAGARNLAWEASMLSKMHHPNIIQLRGVNSEPLSESYSGIGGGYFLLLDVLDETLGQRFTRLREVIAASQNTALLFFKEKRQVQAMAMQQRLQDIAIPVVRAMTYLHNTKKIVFRDLKPDNIGFTASGTLKLFDFGLARTRACKHVRGVAGSYRYMSPEVMRGENNGFASDVYSFGVLLWEICTLRRPFDTVLLMRHKSQKDTFQDKVARDGCRPCVKSVACKRTKSIIQDCWEANPDARPTFTRVLLLLSDICILQEQQYYHHSSFKSARLLKISKPPPSTGSSSMNKSLPQLTMEKMQISCRPTTRRLSRSFSGGNNTACSNSSVYYGDDDFFSAGPASPLSHPKKVSSKTSSSPRSSILLKMTSPFRRRNLLGRSSASELQKRMTTVPLIISTEVEEEGMDDDASNNILHVTKVPAV